MASTPQNLQNALDMVERSISSDAASYMTSVTPLLKQITTSLLMNTPAEPEQFILEMMVRSARAGRAYFGRPRCALPTYPPYEYLNPLRLASPRRRTA